MLQRRLLRFVFRDRLMQRRGEAGQRIWFRPAESPSLLRGLSRWEPEQARDWRALARPGDVIYDVGANIGLAVHRFFGLLGGKCAVVAFEPIPRNAELLERNVQCFGEAVAVVRAAVGDREGTITFRQNLEHGALSARADVALAERDADFWHAQAQVEVPMLTLDAFAARGGPRPDFVKLDVEGAGHWAFRGATSLLREARPVLSCSLHNREESDGILEVVRALGYRGVAVRPDGSTAWCALEEAAGNYVHPDGPKAARVSSAA